MTAVAAGRPGLPRPLPARVVVGPAIGAFAVAAGVAGCVLLARNVGAGASADDGHVFWTMQIVGAVAYAVVGGWLAARRVGGLLGPLFLVISSSQATALLVREYGVHGLQVVDGLPADRWLFWVHTWVWVPGPLVLLLVVPLLLPDGALPSRRWRPAVALAVCTVGVSTVGWAMAPYDQLDGPVLDASIGPNPTGAPAGVADGIAVASGPLLLSSAGLAVAALYVRWRRTGADERRAMAWVCYGVAVGIVCAAASALAGIVALSAVGIAALPLCCLVAVTRHRLWDLQLVVRRSLVYGALTATVAVAYAGVVGLVGGAVGASTGAPIVATAVVAMLVLPLHHVLRRSVNRIVYGHAEDPYVTTTRVGMRLGSAVTPEQVTTVVLPEILDEVTRALRLRHLSLVTADGRTFSCGGTVPDDAVELPLRHAGRQVGALHAAPARGGMTRSEQRALGDLAAQAAVAVHGVLLAGELRRERERVVVAREEERRRLRRELHDGVGTALAAARLQAETARDLMAARPDDGMALLDRLEDQLRDVVVDVRALSRDLRPATLDELGLEGALRELGARSASPALPVEVEVEDLGEVPAAMEVAAYLVVAELLTNACRHSHASCVRVLAWRRGSELRVQVSDDGRGIATGTVEGVGLESVRRRVDEVGGRLERRNRPGAVFDVRLPLDSLPLDSR